MNIYSIYFKTSIILFSPLQKTTCLIHGVCWMKYTSATVISNTSPTLTKIWWPTKSSQARLFLQAGPDLEECKKRYRTEHLKIMGLKKKFMWISSFYVRSIFNVRYPHRFHPIREWVNVRKRIHITLIEWVLLNSLKTLVKNLKVEIFYKFYVEKVIFKS